MRLFDHQLDQTPPAQVGLVVLQSDESVEPDFKRLLPDALELLVTRIPSGDDVTPETLAAMEGDLSGAVDLFPGWANFKAIGYACTSGAAQIGPARVAQIMLETAGAPASSDPVTALTAACETLGIERLALLSPYTADVSDRLRDVLAAQGIDTPVFGSFNIASEAKVARITPRSIIHAAEALVADAPVDALFLSCTNLRTLDVIERLEDRLGIPVLSSNLVLAWHLARLAGTMLSDHAPGRLPQRNM